MQIIDDPCQDVKYSTESDKGDVVRMKNGKIAVIVAVDYPDIFTKEIVLIPLVGPFEHIFMHMVGELRLANEEIDVLKKIGEIYYEQGAAGRGNTNGSKTRESS